MLAAKQHSRLSSMEIRREKHSSIRNAYLRLVAVPFDLPKGPEETHIVYICGLNFIFICLGNYDTGGPSKSADKDDFLASKM